MRPFKERLSLSAVRKNKQLELKRKCVDHLGGKCSNCGYDKCLAALVFHHLDPKTKDFTISSIPPTKHAFEKLIPELEKCICLCSNCHIEEHKRLAADARFDLQDILSYNE